MPYRIFEDSKKKEWQVWDIVPKLMERRGSSPDRRVETAVIPFADRRRDERRLSNGTRRATLKGSYAQGWLCFDNGREKRRLTPIPSDWTTCDEARLEAYAAQARAVPGSYRGLLSSSEESLAEAG